MTRGPLDAPTRSDFAEIARLARLEETLESIDHGVMTIDGDGRVRTFNERARELLDIPRELLVREAHLSEIVEATACRGAFAGEEAFRIWERAVMIIDREHVFEQHRSDGRVLEVRTVPTRSGGAVRTIRDVSAARAAEERLSARVRRYRVLSESVPHLMWATSPEGETNYANERARAFFGDDIACFMSRAARVHPEDSARLLRMRRIAIETGRAMRVDLRLRAASGSYHWFTLGLEPIREKDKVVEWLATATDIDEVVASREAMREQTALLQLAQEGAGAGVFEWDLVARTASLSRESRRLFGFDLDGEDLVKLGIIASRINIEDWGDIQRAIARAARDDHTFRVEFRIRRTPSSQAWILAIGRVVVGPTGVERVVGFFIDINDRKTFEEELRIRETKLVESRERLALALDVSAGGLWDCDLTTGRIFVNEAWCRISGQDYTGEAQGIEVWSRAIHSEDLARNLIAFYDHLEGLGEELELEFRIVHANGRTVWVSDRSRVVARNASGKPTRIVGLRVDVTDRRSRELQIEYQARHDLLTNLPNRSFFAEILDDRLGRLIERDGRLALMGLDLDRFKLVNDRLGHAAGDALLKEAADRIRDLLEPGDVLSRHGGDEFMLCQVSERQPAAAQALAEKIVSALSQPFVIAGQTVSIGTSIGIAIAPKDGIDVDVLMKHADLALYRAKSEGRSTYRLYEPRMDESERNARAMEMELKSAMSRGEIEVSYQPLIALATGEVRGFEALMRWTSPSRGVISPSEFIPILERTHLVVPFGEHVLRRACVEASRWPSDITIAVNVSGVQIKDPSFAGRIAAILRETGLRPDRLEIEVTETVLVDEDGAFDTLERLRALGVQVALDDFGVAYSSLGYLRRFPFDKIKMDRSFLADFETPQTAAIMSAVIELGHKLGARICVEGVETHEQLAFLRGVACDEVQGFLLARPMSAERARAYFGTALCA